LAQGDRDDKLFKEVFSFEKEDTEYESWEPTFASCSLLPGLFKRNDDARTVGGEQTNNNYKWAAACGASLRKVPVSTPADPQRNQTNQTEVDPFQEEEEEEEEEEQEEEQEEEDPKGRSTMRITALVSWETSVPRGQAWREGPSMEASGVVAKTEGDATAHIKETVACSIEDGIVQPLPRMTYLHL
jgi:hypothetical protein